MSYTKHNWVNVSDPSNPPSNATALSAEVLSEMENGIAGAYNYVDEVVEANRPYKYSGVINISGTVAASSSEYPTITSQIVIDSNIKKRADVYITFQCLQGTTTISSSCVRITLDKINTVAPFRCFLIYALNTDSNSFQYGGTLTSAGNIKDVSAVLVLPSPMSGAPLQATNFELNGNIFSFDMIFPKYNNYSYTIGGFWEGV